MEKQYGLITKANKRTAAAPTFVKLSAFNSDSDSDGQPEESTKNVNLNIGSLQKRQIKKAQENALSEDPTIFQYDELYDDIKQKEKTIKEQKKSADKGAKYISKLLISAERRKKDYERRIERQVQKEREEEGEQFKDKESFVTSSYRAKIEEMKQAEEAESRAEYLESIGDVTKQRDLGGFYRHLFEQKMGADKKPTTDEGTTSTEPSASATDNMPSKKDRVYRKRKSSDNENSDKEDGETEGAQSKKSHIQSNLDADSDFSIDSDSDDSEAATDAKKEPASNMPVFKKPDIPEPAVTKDEQKSTEEKVEIKKKIVDEVKPQKIDKSLIWKKRTVGEILKQAIQRYYERKVLRESN